MMVVMAVMMTMVPPMVAMMVMVSPVAAVMMVVPVTIVVVSPLHVGRQLTCVVLPGDDARADRSRRLRLLRGGRDNQKRAKSGESKNFLQEHVDLLEWVTATAAEDSSPRRERDASDKAMSQQVNAT
ncbi:hypothetical protein [Nitrobacter winogradskyi]|uniref:ABC-type multidrug transport system fused ATPase/permease subunit n=3 Tax=Nitrobacter winogradskyi TaxID=913 RepID=A0ACC6AID8_NITWI|nr:ABC-type multidrug transport system fused ATPase/permease subunit [Nitrobacter winogradskyi]